MEANKLTRNNKDLKKFESQVEALDTFIKLTTVCLTFNNPRVEGEKYKIYSILVALDIVFPEFFEELTTFNSLKIHDRQETILKKLKGTQSDIQNAINLLEETINLEKVEQTPTDYVWWKSFLDDLVTGIA
jgi:hypothetical protein